MSKNNGRSSGRAAIRGNKTRPYSNSKNAPNPENGGARAKWVQDRKPKWLKKIEKEDAVLRKEKT